jgi:hypothetical protein
MIGKKIRQKSPDRPFTLLKTSIGTGKEEAFFLLLLFKVRKQKGFLFFLC